MYDYVEEVENRNKVFTSISRSKSWVRISGVGPSMQKARQEIQEILSDYPRFRFVFPDPDKVARKLDVATHERRQQLKKAETGVANLLQVDPAALAALPPEKIAELLRKLQEVQK